MIQLYVCFVEMHPNFKSNEELYVRLCTEGLKHHVVVLHAVWVVFLWF